MKSLLLAPALAGNTSAMSMRQRGATLIEVVLYLAIALGIMVGGIYFYQQAQSSSDLTDKTRTAVGVSSEVRSQYRTQASYGAADTDITSDVMDATALDDSVFNNLTITAQDQEFDLTFSNLNEQVCNRLETTDLGPNSSIDAATTDCATGTLVVTYSR